MRIVHILLALLAFALCTRPLPVLASVLQTGEQQLKTIESLTGTWDYKGKTGVLTDVFQPFANGTAVLGEELLNGKQITSTVFYVVDGQLYADHYCDYKNQPRYTAVSSTDQNVIDFEFREATNIDAYPVFFKSTTWTILDADHMVQDWYVQGGTKPNALVHMTFTKRKSS